MTDDSAMEGLPGASGLHEGEHSAVGNAVCIAGLVGDSCRQGVFRVYTRPDLAEFFEIHEDQVRNYRELEKSESPLGGSLFWVDADALLLRVFADVVRAESAAQSPRPTVT